MNPIKFTVENKNNVYKFSNYFEVNQTLSLIRIIRLTPLTEGEEYCDLLHILKRATVKNYEISLNGFDANCMPPSIMDIPAHFFIKYTDDFKFELINNSKIEVNLFFKNKTNETPKEII